MIIYPYKFIYFFMANLCGFDIHRNACAKYFDIVGIKYFYRHNHITRAAQ